MWVFPSWAIADIKYNNITSQVTLNEIEAIENIFRINAHVFPRLIEQTNAKKEHNTYGKLGMEWPSGSLSTSSSAVTIAVDYPFRNAHTGLLCNIWPLAFANSIDWNVKNIQIAPELRQQKRCK